MLLGCKLTVLHCLGDEAIELASMLKGSLEIHCLTKDYQTLYRTDMTTYSHYVLWMLGNRLGTKYVSLLIVIQKCVAFYAHIPTISTQKDSLIKASGSTVPPVLRVVEQTSMTEQL